MKKILLMLYLIPALTNAQALENLYEIDDSEFISWDSLSLVTPESAPRFPGGEDSLHAFIIKEIQFPKHDTCQTETIWIGFVVEINGDITNIEVLRGKCKAFIDEAIRLVKVMPKWIPGKFYNKFYRTKMRFPIKFI